MGGKKEEQKNKEGNIELALLRISLNGPKTIKKDLLISIRTVKNKSLSEETKTLRTP